MLQVENGIYNGQVINANATNNSVNTVITPEANYKEFYSLYAKSKTSALSDVDSLALVTLAQLCPDFNGAAVYQARALYNYLYRRDLYISDVCNATTNSRMKNNVDASGENLNIWNVDLFPNPTSSNVTLVSKTENENLNVRIADITGKIVYTDNLTTNNFISKLELNLTNGIYLITIKNSHNESITKKLVIAK